jgi:hypothetical protein
MMFMLLFILLYGSFAIKLKEDYKYEVDSGFKLPEGPIFAKGWLKYTTYIPDSGVKPKEFENNKQFMEQFKNGPLDVTQADKVGFINIPDEQHFFFILSEGGVNIVSSRKVFFIK